MRLFLSLCAGFLLMGLVLVIWSSNFWAGAPDCPQDNHLYELSEKWASLCWTDGGDACAADCTRVTATIWGSDCRVEDHVRVCVPTEHLPRDLREEPGRTPTRRFELR